MINPRELPVHRLDLPLPGTIGEEPLQYRGRDMLTREVVEEARV